MSTTVAGGSRTLRALRTLSTILIAAGVLLLADAALTLLWQEPFSGLYAHVQQDKLSKRLAELENVPVAPIERAALDKLRDPRRRMAFAARSLERRMQPGDPIGRIRMAAVGVSDVMVQGTGTPDLRKGPGHYPSTPLPGEHGTVGVAGHRTTYGAPFRHLDGLGRGDRVEITMPYGRFTYRVERTRIVAPSAVWVTDPVGYDRLILSACHPLYSAAHRIVVFARLVGATARGPAAS
jgi:sortase A